MGDMISGPNSRHFPMQTHAKLGRSGAHLTTHDGDFVNTP